jgi:hypothetical protein
VSQVYFWNVQQQPDFQGPTLNGAIVTNLSVIRLAAVLGSTTVDIQFNKNLLTLLNFINKSRKCDANIILPFLNYVYQTTRCKILSDRSCFACPTKSRRHELESTYVPYQLVYMAWKSDDIDFL